MSWRVMKNTRLLRMSRGIIWRYLELFRVKSKCFCRYIGLFWRAMNTIPRLNKAVMVKYHLPQGCSCHVHRQEQSGIILRVSVAVYKALKVRNGHTTSQNPSGAINNARNAL